MIVYGVLVGWLVGVLLVVVGRKQKEGVWNDSQVFSLDS